MTICPYWNSLKRAISFVVRLEELDFYDIIYV